MMPVASPENMLPDLSRTATAMRAWDAWDQSAVLDNACVEHGSAAVEAWYVEDQRLRLVVGTAFALDTADRNQPNVAGIVAKKLPFVRACVNRWLARQVGA